MFQNSVNASQKTQRHSITKNNPLMHFREIVYCESYMRHTNKLRGQNADIQYVKSRRIYIKRLVLIS
jgi:hypothetical protein